MPPRSSSSLFFYYYLPTRVLNCIIDFIVMKNKIMWSMFTIHHLSGIRSFMHLSCTISQIQPDQISKYFQLHIYLCPLWLLHGEPDGIMQVFRRASLSPSVWNSQTIETRPGENLTDQSFLLESSIQSKTFIVMLGIGMKVGPVSLSDLRKFHKYKNTYVSEEINLGKHSGHIK